MKLINSSLLDSSISVDEIDMSMLSVLVVDDSIGSRKLIQVLLEKAGYHVRVAVDGEHGLEMLNQFAADVILMDFLLPGISGADLTRQLKSDPTRRNSIVIAFTAYTLSSDVDRALAAGCDAFIAKPINPRTFVSQFRSYIEQAKANKQQSPTIS
jgi:two-component system cell cycle response regulator DivK